MELEIILKSIGLNLKEAKVYLACLQLGEETVFNIAKKAEIKRPTTYLILQSLAEKGLVSLKRTKKATYYNPISPKRLVVMVRTKIKGLEEVLPQLEALYRERPQKPSIQIFEGKEGMTTIYQDVINSLEVDQEVLCYSSLIQFKQTYERQMKDWLRATKNKKYRIREIINEGEYEREYFERIKKNKNPNHQIRVFPSVLNLIDNDNIIYDNKLAIFSFQQEELFVIVIESNNIVKSYRNFFELAWRQAKKP